MIVDVFDKGKAVGKALVFTDKHSFYKYRDKIKIEGKILVPQNLDGFDYRGYLSKSGVVVTISYPKIDIVERKYYSNFFQKFQYFVYEFKDSRSEKIKDLMPPKLSPILEAMILGNDSKMSKEVKENLSKSGLSHAIAISGSHIVLFSAMIFWVLLFLGFWRKHAIIFSMMFTLFYVFFVGMMASAFRAGIMMTMLFIAELFDRKAFNLRTLILAAFIMLIFNPLLLKYDLGFQLSFLAVLGIILMAPIFNQWLSFIKWNYLREIIAVTLTAQIFTLPILISSFGYFSIISIVTNILIAPIIAPLMGLGILIPFLPHFLSFLLSIPCTLLLSYLMWVVDFSAQIPFAVLNIKIPIIFLLFLYAPLFLISHKMKKKDLDFLGQ
jgi:competence protein ComEC